MWNSIQQLLKLLLRTPADWILFFVFLLCMICLFGVFCFYIYNMFSKGDPEEDDDTDEGCIIRITIEKGDED